MALANSPCSTFKTLTIMVSVTGVAPLNGFVVKWKVSGTSTYTTVANQPGPVLYIANVPACSNIEGTVQTDCASGLGTAVPFSVSSSVANCVSFTLSQTATYTYIPCAGSVAVEINNTSGSPTVICAKDGSVTGGSFINSGTLC